MKLCAKSAIIAAISILAFTSSAYANPTFHELIVNFTSSTIHIMPTSHSEVHHVSNFKQVLKPGGNTTVKFTVDGWLSEYSAYINQHISTVYPYKGKNSTCFEIRFKTNSFTGIKGKDEIEHCGSKNRDYRVVKHGDDQHYAIFIYDSLQKLKHNT